MFYICSILITNQNFYTVCTSTKSKSVISSKSISALFEDKNIKGGVFTIKSLKTNTEFTYSISRSEFNKKWYTHVNVEMGYLNFNRLGTYINGKITNKGSLVNTPSAQAIAFVLKAVEDKRFDWLDSVMNTYHIGKCIRCGKELTDSQSIELGLGPICADKL